jgi:hypothetical protein
MRLHLAEQEIEGDPRDDITATAELPVVARSEEPAV